jgi:hypothetical protein
MPAKGAENQPVEGERMVVTTRKVVHFDPPRNRLSMKFPDDGRWHSADLCRDTGFQPVNPSQQNYLDQMTREKIERDGGTPY